MRIEPPSALARASFSFEEDMTIARAPSAEAKQRDSSCSLDQQCVALRIPPRVTRPCQAVTAAQGKVAASTEDRCAGTETSAVAGSTTYPASTPSSVRLPRADGR